MRFRVDNNCFDNYRDAIDYCIEDRFHEDDDYEFRDWVNEKYGSLDIYGETYYAYDILDSMSSSTLDYLMDDYCEYMNDEDIDNARSELYHADIGDQVCVHNSVIEVVDDESGDFDGDNKLSRIDDVRNFIEEQKVLKSAAEAEEKKTEDDIMNLFQVIGG